MERDKNRKAFEAGKIEPATKNIGKGFIETLVLNKTIRKYSELFQKDPYIWLRSIDEDKSKWPWLR